MIRRATIKDIPQILKLLQQVLNIHAKLRPDIFIINTTKYTYEELEIIINDDNSPIFVYEDDHNVLGYIFTKIIFNSSNNTKDYKTLFIDDLCIDENARSHHLGQKLYEYAKRFAKNNGCYNIILNVWHGNNALTFYQKMGLKPMKYVLEDIL